MRPFSLMIWRQLILYSSLSQNIFNPGASAIASDRLACSGRVTKMCSSWAWGTQRCLLSKKEESNIKLAQVCCQKNAHHQQQNQRQIVKKQKKKAERDNDSSLVSRSHTADKATQPHYLLAGGGWGCPLQYISCNTAVKYWIWSPCPGHWTIILPKAL